jgi:hypothetical protein
MSDFPQGTFFNYHSGDWKTNYFHGPAEIVSEVQQKISGQIAIKSHKESIAGIVGNVDAYLGAPALFGIDLTAQVDNGLGFGAIDDAGKIIGHAVYEVTGMLPTFTITSVQLPGGSSQSTGEPDPSKGSGGSADNSSNPFQSLEDFFSGLTSKASLWLMLVSIGLIAGIILVSQAKSGELK